MIINNIKILSPLQKLKHIKYRNNRNNNFFPIKNPTFSNTNYINYSSRNDSNKARDIIKTSSSSKVFPLKYINLKNNRNYYNQKNNNIFINSYKYKSNLNPNKNIRTILFNNDNISKFHFNQINKTNSIIKVNQAVNTSNLFLYNNKLKTKLNNKHFSNEKNIANLYNINNLNEIYALERKKLKNQKAHKTIKDYFSERLKRDKYAYIYLSDNAESIKFSRRVNYNPLDV